MQWGVPLNSPMVGYSENIVGMKPVSLGLRPLERVIALSESDTLPGSGEICIPALRIRRVRNPHATVRGGIGGRCQV